MALLRYQQSDGREPFTDWLSRLRDKVAAARIRVRLRLARRGRRASAVWRRQENPDGGYSARQESMDGMEAEANMIRRTLKGIVSHHDREVTELAADPELTLAYLKAAMEALDDPDARAGGLLALRTVVEAHGGLGAVAARAGISRESLYRSLSGKGNPTLKTLLAVLKTVGLRLSVETERDVAV